MINWKAEDKKKEILSRIHGCLGGDAEYAVKSILEDLHIHQIELETQNQELRETQSELEASRLELAELYDFAPVPYLTIDAKGTIIKSNLAASSWLAPSSSSLCGRSIYMFTADKDRQKLFRFFQRKLSKDDSESETVELNMMDHKRQPFYIRLQITKRCHLRDYQPQFLVAALDLTKKRELETRLLRTKEAANAANLAKSTFLSNMSHEIRTPMAAIIGYADIILGEKLPSGEPLPEAIKCKLSSIYRNGKHLLQLINDILDIAKIEAGKVRIEFIDFSLAELIRDTVSMYRNIARNKGLYIEVHAEEKFPEKVHGDPLRLKQILLNLLGNAIKFTEKGGVTLCLRAIAGDGVIECEVRDTGCGIRPEAAKRIFQPFEQADSSTTRKFGGTGLGLHLSRRLAALLNGNIELRHSKPGQGSTFALQLPMQASSGSSFINLEHYLKIPADSECLDTAARLEQQLENPLKGIKILLAEDGEDNQIIYNMILQNAGAEVDVVGDGKMAITKVMANTYDVVLMDIQMPLMDGHEATKRLRQLGVKKPILALSAHAVKSEVAKSLGAGCNDHITKPIRFTELIDRIKDWHKKINKPATLPSQDKEDPDLEALSTAENCITNCAEINEQRRDFAGRIPLRLREVMQYCQERDWNNVCRLSHKLKGSTGTFGFMQLHEQMSKIEEASRSSKPQKGYIASLIQEAEASCKRLM